MTSLLMSGLLVSGCSSPNLKQRDPAPVEDRASDSSRSVEPVRVEDAESTAIAYVAPSYVPPPAKRIGQSSTGAAGRLSGRSPSRFLGRAGQSAKAYESTPAVKSLLAKAARADQPDLAAASLERALRIEPTDPRVWHKLANIRLQQGRFIQAEAVALKSNSLAAEWPAVWPKNWSVIASARRKMGDDEGASQALRMRASGKR